MSHPLIMDGEKLYRCPLRPFKDNPKNFGEIFSLYSFSDKGVLPEPGAYFDQPNAYIESIMEMQSAVSDTHAVSEEISKQRKLEGDKSLDKLRALGLNVEKKSR